MKNKILYCAAILALWALPFGARAQVTGAPLNTLSAAGAVSSTDTMALCQTSAGCGSAQSMLSATAAQLDTYIASTLGANPSATAGPTANNGSATTFMRSDASPAIQSGSATQQGILECGSGTSCTAGVISATGSPSLTTGVSAAGSSQSTATALTGSSIVSTVAQGTGVSLPTPTAGQNLMVCDTGANPLRVYPETSGAITPANTTTALTTTSGYTAILKGACRNFLATSTTAWQMIPVTAPGVFLVSDFGATGDGVTDDTAAWQAAENAAEALGGGTLKCPRGIYLINSGPINIAAGGIKWQGSAGVNVQAGTPPGCDLQTSSATAGYKIVSASPGSLVIEGPTFRDIAFSSQNGTRTATGVFLQNIMNGVFDRTSFFNLLNGIEFDSAVGDASNWEIGHSAFWGDNSGVLLQGVHTDPGSNTVGIHDNYFNLRTGATSTTDGDCGVDIVYAQQVRFTGNKVDGSTSGNGALNYAVCAAYVSGLTITNNNIEDPATLWWNPSTLDSNNGRGVTIADNTHSGGTGFTQTQTCTSTNGSATLSCSAVTNLVRGMAISSSAGVTDIHTWATGDSNNFNTWNHSGQTLGYASGAGGTHIVSISGTTVTMDANAGAGAGSGHTMTFCIQPVYRFAYGTSNTAGANSGNWVVNSNHYSNDGACGFQNIDGQ